MPHSAHIDRWQREREGTPDPATPEEHIARMRDLLTQAESRARVEAEGRAIRRANAREDAYWRRVHGCPDCGVVGGHHPSCGYGPELADTIEEANGER